MLINLPEDWEDVEKAYNQIEMYCGSRGGQYPIGKDNWWHSGVHIHGGKPIKPLIKGKIIACRLADKFACIPRIKKFDDVEYSKLNDLERPLYAEDKNMYTLQHEGINQQALDELEKKHKGIKSWFEKSGEVYNPIEKVDTEYVLLEHQALFPQQSGQSKPLNFFTLYMGISTRVSELEQYYKGFIEVTEKVTMRIPMFQKWVFRLNYKNAVKKHRYRYNESESGGFNVFAYSTCDFVQSSNDADKYECTFTNDQGASKRSIDVPKDCITLNPATDIKYKTVREVPVYKKNARGTIVGRAIATLNAEINFTSLNEYTEDYYEVVVYNSECKKYEEPVLSGWVAGAGKQGGSAPFQLKGKSVYTIAQINEIPDGFLVIKRKDYNAALSWQYEIAPQEGEKLLFFERQPRYPNNQNTKYSFYYQGEKIKFELKSSNEFDELYARRVTYVKGLSIYQWTSMEEFREDDYVILDNSRTPPHIIPGYVMDKEEISYCRFSFPESGTVKNALIRKTDIKEYGSGYIKAPGGEPNSELYDISNYDLFSFLDGVIEGCIVYDSYSGNTRGNARECLEKQRTGVSVEFETDEPYPLLDVCQNVTPYLITLGDDRRYLLIDEGVKVEAKIEYKEGFEERTKIITPTDMKTEEGEILGYPAAVPREREPMYDLILFFKEEITESFFDSLGWKGCPKSEYYVKPENFKSVYSRDESITMTEDGGGAAYPKYTIRVEEGKAEDIFKEVNGGEGSDNKELELGKPVHAVTLTIGEIAVGYYYGFEVDKKTYYVKGDGKEPQGLEKKNYLDLSEHLIRMAAGGTENSICSDHRWIEEAIGEEKQDNFQKFLGLYTDRSEEGLTKRRKVRSLVCKHHLEWNEGLYDTTFSETEKVSGEYLENLKAKMGKQELWSPSGAESKLPPKGQIWFAHPIYFANHLDKAGVLDQTFNPYLGHTFGNGRATEVTVVDNPGFAPVAASGEYEHKGIHYIAPKGTDLFNEDYSEWYGGATHWHNGIDFGCPEGTDIRSFIYGEVWACTWRGTLDPKLAFADKAGEGKVMIIKDRESNKIYLLAHLSDFVKKSGDLISPGDIVAKSGNTGKSSGPHLHLEVRDCGNRKEKDAVLDKDANLLPGSGKGKELKWDKNITPLCKNPFDHRIPLK